MVQKELTQASRTPDSLNACTHFKSANDRGNSLKTNKTQTGKHTCQREISETTGGLTRSRSGPGTRQPKAVFME